MPAAWLRRIPGKERLKAVYNTLRYAYPLLRELYLAQCLGPDPRYSDARRLVRHEHQVWSQGGEDGIVNEIFRRIGVAGRTFIEFGVGDGLENNTLNLLAQGWSGCWIEAGRAHAAHIRRKFREPLTQGQLTPLQEKVTAGTSRRCSRGPACPGSRTCSRSTSTATITGSGRPSGTTRRARWSSSTTPSFRPSRSE